MKFPPTAALLAAVLFLSFIVYAIPLAGYWSAYFPFEDDFSLLRFSAREYRPSPASWFTDGYRWYFANDPSCPRDEWGFIRPFSNITHYLESWLSPVAEGLRLLYTNFACFLCSLALMFVTARRLRAGPWESALATFLCALSPVWYRNMLHSTFRNNPLGAMWTMAAFALILGPANRLRWTRTALAGTCVALAIASHDQGKMSLAVVTLAVVYLEFRAPAEGRIGRVLRAAAGAAIPGLFILGLFRWLSGGQGANYVATTVRSWMPSDPLHFLIYLVAAPLIRFMAILVPIGPDNPFPAPMILTGILVLIPILTAFWLLGRRNPNTWFAGVVAVLFATPVAILGLGEPRFRCLEVCWALLFLACVLTAARTEKRKLSRVAAYAGVLAVLSFNAISFGMNVAGRRSDWLARNDVDRRAFQMIRAAAKRRPDARFVLVNDQAATWSQASMLAMAGVETRNVEILPTIAPGVSADFPSNLHSCGSEVSWEREGNRIHITLRFPGGCHTVTFGRDLKCTLNRFRSAGLDSNAAWAECSATWENYCSPLTHDVQLRDGESAMLVVWRTRFEAPEVIEIPGAPALLQ